jgi:hypothetical protein
MMECLRVRLCFRWLLAACCEYSVYIFVLHCLLFGVGFW